MKLLNCLIGVRFKGSNVNFGKKVETFVYTVVSLFIVIPFLVPSSLQARSRIVINEILYDPKGADDGYEFVEIVNISEMPICLEGWFIESGNGNYPDRWRVEWVGSKSDTVFPGQFIVIGERLVTPTPNFVRDLDLQNGPDACRIRSSDGETDVVGWGAIDYECYYETSPAIDVPSGESLGRYRDGIDTDCNRDDFTSFASPSPGDYNYPPFDLKFESLSVTKLSASPSQLPRAIASIANVGSRSFGSGAHLFLFMPGSIVEDMLSDDIEPLGKVDLIIDMPVVPPGRHLLKGIVVHNLDRWNSNDTLTTSFVIEPPPIVINEIMFCPPRNQCEWVELFCRDGPVDLVGWTIEESNRKRSEITSSGLEITSGEFIVIVENLEAFNANYGDSALKVVKPVKSWQALNDEDGPSGIADYIVIRDGFGTLIDSVAYCETWARCGTSIERISADQSSTDPANWSPHYGTRSGSPGKINSVSAFHFDSRGILSISPRIFNPDKDGSKGLLSVKINLPEPSQVWLKIHDLNGYEIVKLIDGAIVQSARITFWDGKDKQGRAVPPGVYIINLRAGGSGREYKELKPVVVSRKAAH